MKRIFISFFIFTSLIVKPMEQSKNELIQKVLQSYRSAKAIYIRPSQALGVINLLNEYTSLNSLSTKQKEELREIPSELYPVEKGILQAMAEAITLESECGQPFLIPKLKSGLLNENEIKILPFKASTLKLFQDACWFMYFTDSLYWMRCYQSIKQDQIDQLLQVEDYCKSDFVRKTINETNQRTGKF